MKTIYSIAFLATMIVAGCQPKTIVPVVNKEAEKDAIVVLLNKYLTAVNNKDMAIMETLFTDDGLYCGTDPTEVIDKQTMLKLKQQNSTDMSRDYTYTVEKREIRLSPDGLSAIILEQFVIPGLAPNMPVRLIFGAIKKGDNWIFDFVSWSFIPNNADIEKINKALE
jgi:hypothetical protein